MLTQERLRQLFHYDSMTGVFTRIQTNRIDRLNKPAGAPNTKGHIQIKVDGKLYVAHRLAWLYVYGTFPNDQLDHINGIKSDNRMINIREATNKQNQENVPLQSNNTSGYRGVSFDKQHQKFRAYICHNHTLIHLGLFRTAEQAGQVARSARDKLFTHNKTEYSA